MTQLASLGLLVTSCCSIVVYGDDRILLLVFKASLKFIYGKKQISCLLADSMKKNDVILVHDGLIDSKPLKQIVCTITFKDL